MFSVQRHFRFVRSYTKHHLKFRKNQADNLEYIGFRHRFFPLFYWYLVLSALIINDLYGFHLDLLQRLVVRVGFNVSKLTNDVKSLENLSENCVAAVEERCAALFVVHFNNVLWP